MPLLSDAWTIVAPRLADRAGSFVFDARAASVSAAFTRARAALAIKALHVHDLRHRATAQFFRMGLDIPRLARLTGHKTWAMLRRYTDIKPADVHTAIARHASESRNIVRIRERKQDSMNGTG